MSRLFRGGEIVNIIESVLNRVYVLFVAMSFWLIKPEASQPEASQPAGSQPEASQPEASQPAGSQPEASQPAGSQPEASQPAGSQPEASQPEASEHISVYGLTLTEGWD